MTMRVSAEALRVTQEKAAVLVQAFPYIRQYAGKRVVVKVGGEIALDPRQMGSFVGDLALLRMVGVEVVLCHGGGPQISRMMRLLGREAVFKDGLRVTDEETMEVTAMVLLGDVNRRFVALLNTHGPLGIGVSGLDGQLFQVVPQAPELGYVGKISHVTSDPIERILADDYIPVVASLGMDAAGAVYNINADTAAGELAVALGAEKLVVLTNVAGLYETFGNEDSLLSEIDVTVLQRLVISGALSEGMIPKVEAILAALQGGVPRACVIDGRVDHAVLLEIFTPEGFGTMITGKSL